MSNSVNKHEQFMEAAYRQALLAYEEGEIPVGAVVVSNERIIARAYNQTEKLKDVTAHAEMIALTAASNFLGAKYLTDCSLYVTLEPCIMCAGALYWGQFKEVIFGAYDPKRGFERVGKHLLHPKTQLTGGVLQEKCKALIDAFFRELRK